VTFAELSYSEPEPAIGTVATYTCLPGYTPTTPTVLQCLADRTWAGTVPNCTLIECERPLNSTDSIIYPDRAMFVVGDCVTFECHVGFTLTGSNTIECQEFGWNGSFPICLPVDCGLVPVIAHGQVSYVTGTTYQQEAHIECEPGYNLTGSHTVVCDSTGTWNPGVPTCNVIGTFAYYYYFLMQYVAITRVKEQHARSCD